MRVLASLFAWIICVTLTGLVAGQENAGTGKAVEADAQTAAREFSFLGVPFGASVEDLKNKHPAVKECGRFSEPKSGKVVYELEGAKEDPHAWVLWTFSDGKMISFRTGYSPDGFSRAGGWEAFLERLKKRVGEPHSGREVNDSDLGGQGVVMHWQFPDVSRSFSFEVYPRFAYLNGTDIDGQKALDAKKAASSNLGF